MGSYNQIHRYGTQEQYDAIEVKNPDYLYFTSDTGKLYKGTVDYTDAFMTTATVGETGIAGKIYLETSTGQVKAYVGNQWEVISYPLEVAIDDSNASSYAVPSVAGVVEYVESKTGSGDLVAGIDNDATTVGGKLVITKADNSTAALNLQGVAVNPTWDASARRLQIPVMGADGTTDVVDVNIGKDIFLDPTEGASYYDPTTKDIVLTLNDADPSAEPPKPATQIRIPASALYNDYVGGTSNSGTVSIDSSSHVITFDLNIDASTKNALVLTSDGLMVDLEAYATTAAVDTIRENLQTQIDSTTATLAQTTASLDTLTTNYNNTTSTLNDLQSNYNNTTAALDTLTGNYNATTAELATLEGNYNATTAELAGLKNDYNATTAELATLEGNYNNTTAALDTLTGNYNATTAALATLTSNYNATTVTVAQNTQDISDLATAATTWAGFTD